ncbi:MAG: hypothetical protein FWG78_02915 [Coriobacteriia bacterium]|nr:hypothetical protein [Coriobacteriia bacterium]
MSVKPHTSHTAPFAWLKRALFGLPEPLRFLLAGAVNTAFGYLLFAFGLFLLTTPLEALAPYGGIRTVIADNYFLVVQWIMWFFSVPFGAFTLKYYAFQSAGPYLPQAVRSYAVYLPAQLLASVLLFAFTHLFANFLGSLAPLIIAGRAIDPTVLLAQFCTIFFTTIVSYLGHKSFTFRAPHA